MQINRRHFIASGVASVASMTSSATVARALEGSAFFDRDRRVPDWLNLSGTPAWFGVDVMVSPRGPDELATIWLTRSFGQGSGWGVSFLTTMTTRELAAEREEPLAVYTVAPIRPLRLGECMAYVKGNALPLDKITSNAVWTGSPFDAWSGLFDSRYQFNNGRKYEGIEEFAWIA